jgi:FdrA protein
LSETGSSIRTTVRRGAYHDSIVLMRLQAALLELPGVADAGVVMATAVNRALLADRGLLPAALEAGAEDLVIALRGETPEQAESALGRVDELLAHRASGAAGYRPRSLETARRLAPEAGWVLVSVPGRHAAPVARRALDLGRHVFLYSDNVPLEAERELKEEAARRGLLVLGPDCGTAILGGAGLGFANRVRRGPVGLVAASGTGLQLVATLLHECGSGVSHALGTGGRDLSREVGAATALAALDLLHRDEATGVVVLISKPPDPETAARLLAAARTGGKPTVVCFLGHPPPARRVGDLWFAADLADAAELAAGLAGAPSAAFWEPGPVPRRGFLRGLFSGGTLAAEAARALSPFLRPLASNLAGPGLVPLPAPTGRRGHTVVDLGADELTVGRLHPMLDPGLLLERLEREAADPETALILLDVVLGDGAAGDPAARLAPVLARATGERGVPVLVVLVGTDQDPQGLDAQREQLLAAGARVFSTVAGAVTAALDSLFLDTPARAGLPVELAALAPRGFLNVGLESFAESLATQGMPCLHIDWRPPAGGDPRLLEIVGKVRG